MGFFRITSYNSFHIRSLSKSWERVSSEKDFSFPSTVKHPQSVSCHRDNSSGHQDEVTTIEGAERWRISYTQRSLTSYSLFPNRVLQPPTTSQKYHSDEILEHRPLYSNQKNNTSQSSSGSGRKFFLKAFSGNSFQNQTGMGCPSSHPYDTLWTPLCLGSLPIFWCQCLFCIPSFLKAETISSSPRIPRNQHRFQNKAVTHQTVMDQWIHQWLNFRINKATGCTVYRNFYTHSPIWS